MVKAYALIVANFGKSHDVLDAVRENYGKPQHGGTHLIDADAVLGPYDVVAQFDGVGDLRSLRDALYRIDGVNMVIELSVSGN